MHNNLACNTNCSIETFSSCASSNRNWLVSSLSACAFVKLALLARVYHILPAGQYFGLVSRRPNLHRHAANRPGNTRYINNHRWWSQSVDQRSKTSFIQVLTISESNVTINGERQVTCLASLSFQESEIVFEIWWTAVGETWCVVTARWELWVVKAVHDGRYRLYNSLPNLSTHNNNLINIRIR